MPTPLATIYIDATPGSGSTTIDVPAGTTGVVAFSCHWTGNSGSVLGTLSLGGQSLLPALQQMGDQGDANGAGIFFLPNPPTGQQLVQWAWTPGGARGEGGEIVFIFLTDLNSDTPVRGWDLVSATFSQQLSLTIQTAPDDLILAFAERYYDPPGGTPALAVDGGDPLLQEANFNRHAFVVAQVTPSAGSTTTISMTGEYYSTLAVISLPAAALLATRHIAASLECETDADIEAAIARVLASVAEVEPDAAALVRPTRGVTAAVEGEGDAATAVQPARSIAAPLESETELHAQLVVTAIVQLAAVLEAEGAVTGGLRVARELAAVVDAEVVADAAPEVRRLLAAQLAADADAAARLAAARALAAALEADVDASAALLLETLLITTLRVQVVGAGRTAMASVVAGPAVRRVVLGPALSRAVRGPALRRFEIQGPAAS